MLILLPLMLMATLGQTQGLAVPSCFPRQAHLSAFEARWFCGQLSAAGKGPLSGAPAYRLAYMPSFRPTKIVEVRREASGWLIQTTVLGGAGGFAPGVIRERRQRWLTPDEAIDLELTVKRSNVWQQDVRVQPNVLDGSTLVFEAVQPGSYRLHVLFGLPGAGPHPLVELGQLLFAMGGIDEPEK
jgi:hypothetical protein